MSEKVQLQVYFLYLLRRLNHNPKLEKLSGYLCKRIGSNDTSIIIFFYIDSSTYLVVVIGLNVAILHSAKMIKLSTTYFPILLQTYISLKLLKCTFCSENQ